jgi:hypothetical protein
LLPLAVSANFVAMLCLDEYGLAEIIVDGAEAFETQYGIGLKDFLKVSQELYVTLAAALAEQGHRLPRSMCPI